jgi:hypothetical protein
VTFDPLAFVTGVSLLNSSMDVVMPGRAFKVRKGMLAKLWLRIQTQRS